MKEDNLQQITALEAQEPRLVFTRFENADAWRLGSAMVAAATDRSSPVTIDIRKSGRRPNARALPEAGQVAEFSAQNNRMSPRCHASP